jgi:hypothetical protein
MSRVANATILQVEVPAAEGPADFQFGPVSGYVFRKDGKLYVPFIVSSAPERGWGGRCIEALEKRAGLEYQVVV